MKKYFYVVALAISVLAVSCGNKGQNKIEGTESQEVATTDGQELIVDKTASSVHWHGFKPGSSHHGTVAIKEGTLTTGADNTASGSFTIDMNSIVDKDLTDEKMNSMLVDHLKSADFFDVAQYPESKFSITKVEAVTNDTISHMISGNLKIKDVEKNISFGAKITKDGDTYKAVTVPFTIDRTQWNVKYGSKSVFAELKDNVIEDNIELQITIVAKANK